MSTSKKFREKITRKYRLVIEDSESFEKLYSLKLSPWNVFVVGGVFSFLLVSFTSVLIAYTPLKEYIPGYESSKLKQTAKDLVYQVDSLQQRLLINDLKIQALIPILSGEEPVSEFDLSQVEQQALDLKKADTINLAPSEDDLAFREEVEQADRYSLFEEATQGNELVFFSPVTGSITNTFNSEEKHYAVDVVVKKGSPVKAVADGVVIFAEWTTETGYVIIVEHGNGYISVYKHNESLNKEQGDLVLSGEVIATVGSTGELSSGAHLHFELWNNGYPVNPLNFIDFE
ncbi:M23 family metallopeptidase [Flavobacteriaceae bacterium]|nr:M23 family metallopeptidase [Flavobacteriaceae bacterium]